MADSRKHHVQWNAQLLGDVDVRKARGVGNDGVGDKGLLSLVSRQSSRKIKGLVATVWLEGWPGAVARLDARPPTPEQHFLNAPAPLADLAALESVNPGHESGVLDHEGHELGRIAPNAKELEVILENEVLEGCMGRDADAMAVVVLENLAKSDKGLDIAAGTDNLNDDVEGRRKIVRAGFGPQAGWQVRKSG